MTGTVSPQEVKLQRIRMQLTSLEREVLAFEGELARDAYEATDQLRSRLTEARKRLRWAIEDVEEAIKHLDDLHRQEFGELA